MPELVTKNNYLDTSLINSSFYGNRGELGHLGVPAYSASCTLTYASTYSTLSLYDPGFRKQCTGSVPGLNSQALHALLTSTLTDPLYNIASKTCRFQQHKVAELGNTHVHMLAYTLRYAYCAEMHTHTMWDCQAYIRLHNVLYISYVCLIAH